MKKLLQKLFAKNKSVYGPRIFEQESWLSRRVDDALWQRRFPVN